MEKKLRIGFIISEANEVPAWYYETIQRIASNDELELLFIRTRPKKETKQHLFYRLFQRFENTWFRSENDASNPIPVEAFLHPGNNIAILPESDFIFSEEDQQKISRLALNLIYTVDFNEDQDENISHLTQYGLWYLKFGHGIFQGTPPAFWEVMKHSPVTGSSLLAKKENKTWILYNGTTRSVPYSAKNNFSSIALKSSSYLPFRVNELGNSDNNFLSRFELADQPSPANKAPGASMLLLFAKNLAGYAGYKLKGILSKKKFTLLYAFESFAIADLKKIKFHPVALPPARFYADPFIIKKDGVHYVFFEEYSDKAGRAHISVIEISNKKLTAPRMALKTPYHLSYPFVFFHENNYYMIPETASNKTVELYRADNFPDRWVFVKNLMEGVELIDVTIHFHQERWWLFANSANHPFVSTNDQLMLFYSDSLFSTNWTAHRQNPIATHIENCRPAGRIFSSGNKLYRPAQNNASEQYGYGLKINEIILLNENEFREREVLSVEPRELRLKAIHHLDFSDELILIDGIVS